MPVKMPGRSVCAEGFGMTDDTLTCPNCLSRLRWPTGLEPGAAVVCPRCRTQFAASRETARIARIAIPETRAAVHDPRRFPERDQPRPFQVEDDEDYPKRIHTFGTTITVHLRIVCAFLGLVILGTLGS